MSEMIGKIATKVDEECDSLIIHFSDNSKIRFYHVQDCCEHVFLEDVCGDWNDIIGHPITKAYEYINNDHESSNPACGSDGSYTWTFYNIGTVRGTVVLRWYGSSNGYYSEEVDVCWI
jgi:hypothetical protein